MHFWGFTLIGMGMFPAGSSISITEREFDFAQEHSKPTFCFVVDEEFPLVSKVHRTRAGASKLKLFKEESQPPLFATISLQPTTLPTR